MGNNRMSTNNQNDQILDIKRLLSILVFLGLAIGIIATLLTAQPQAVTGDAKYSSPLQEHQVPMVEAAIPLFPERPWHPLDSGLNGKVNAITVSETGVYVGGAFTDAGGPGDANYIARWDGINWQALGTGTDGSVSAIAVSGTDVYVGGGFSAAGGVANTTNIARWDGSIWHALGDGLNGTVNAIAVSGSDVYVGG